MYVNGFAELRQHVPQAGMKWITIPVEGLSGSQSLGCTGAVANGVGTVAPLGVVISFSIRHWVDGRVLAAGEGRWEGGICLIKELFRNLLHAFIL